MTKAEARARVRSRMANLLREEAFLDLAAAWEVANAEAEQAVAGMYAQGFTRTEIAKRLDVALSRVPREADLPCRVREESAAVEGVSDDDAESVGGPAASSVDAFDH